MHVMGFLRLRYAEKPATISLGLGRGSLRALDLPRNLLAQEAGQLVRASIHHGGSISTVIRILIRMSISPFLKALLAQGFLIYFKP